ncbi:DoxX family protein [Rhodocytophaga rosea]|uniref:DoxX family protein n=1 Tax=Rhodocytophaga rosea TaxID=2704465 RepID=A0A6C0GD58_9BACT|nr:DoxX family protein [Rhodocytophaga rosea]QHT65916.1 DoxX family protein [Rhodocytophaga rosea]
MNTIELTSTQLAIKPASVKRAKIFYWIFTTLLALLMMVGSIPDILAVPEAQALFKHLGYPVYLLPFLGVAKSLGVIAILVPGFPRLKEWAYAGFTYDLAGAMYSGIAVGDPVSAWAPLLIGMACIAGSYLFYHRLKTASK